MRSSESEGEIGQGCQKFAIVGEIGQECLQKWVRLVKNVCGSG